MCPPGRDIPHPHPRQANPHRPETRPLVTNVSPIPTAHHGRTHRSAPTAYGKMLRKRGIFGKLLPARRNGQDRSLRSPFRSPSKPAHPDEIRTIEQFPRRGGPMCPPSRDNFHPHPTQANPHHLETHPIVTHAKQIRTAHHGRTHGSAPTR